MVVTTTIPNVLLTDQWSKLINLASGGDTLKIALYNSSYTFDATVTTYSTTNELATANGYTQGGATLSGQAISGTTSKKWTFDPVVWTSSGAGFTARYALIYDTTNSNHVVAVVDFGEDVAASGGGTLTLTCHADGLLAISQA